MKNDRWFKYPIKVQPHHTDYSGNVWHGSYLVWLEEARVECLRSINLEFADLVAVDREKGKIMRQLPAVLKDALTRLSQI